MPPFTEHHRIVVKAAELMALGDELEAKLITIQINSRRLPEAMLCDALALVKVEAIG